MTAAPVVLHPSAVRLIRTVLADAFDIPVGRRPPSQTPSRFFAVSRFGGVARTPVTDAPLIGVEAWATDPDEAEDLAQEARQVIEALAGTTVNGITVYLVNVVSGPLDLPPPSGQPRFTFTVEVHVRTSAA